MGVWVVRVIEGVWFVREAQPSEIPTKIGPWWVAQLREILKIFLLWALTLTLQSLLFFDFLPFFVFRFSLLFLSVFPFPRILGVPRREKPLLFFGGSLAFFQKSKGWRVREASEICPEMLSNPQTSPDFFNRRFKLQIEFQIKVHPKFRKHTSAGLAA